MKGQFFPNWLGLTLGLVFLSFEFLASAERAGSIVPLYVWPMESNGVHSWQPLIAAKRSHPQVPVYAIVNVENGPGTSIQSDYTSSMPKLLSAGIKLLGYVRTNYAKRGQAEIKSDIDQWVRYYPNSLSGIFFDEMAYEVSSKKNRKTKRGTQKSVEVNYYTELSRYAKSKPGLNYTVGNPGTDTKPEFVDSVDTIIIFETNTGFPGNDRLGGWHTNKEKSNWGIMPYGIELNEADVRRAKNYVKYIYVQNDNLPNPWDTLPSFLNSLFRVLNEE